MWQATCLQQPTMRPPSMRAMLSRCEPIPQLHISPPLLPDCPVPSLLRALTTFSTTHRGHCHGHSSLNLPSSAGTPSVLNRVHWMPWSSCLTRSASTGLCSAESDALNALSHRLWSATSSLCWKIQTSYSLYQMSRKTQHDHNSFKSQG